MIFSKYGGYVNNQDTMQVAPCRLVRSIFLAAGVFLVKKGMFVNFDLAFQGHPSPFQLLLPL
jgi:hypothetical protein